MRRHDPLEHAVPADQCARCASHRASHRASPLEFRKSDREQAPRYVGVGHFHLFQSALDASRVLKQDGEIVESYRNGWVDGEATHEPLSLGYGERYGEVLTCAQIMGERAVQEPAPTVGEQPVKEGGTLRVFLSYSRRDLIFVRDLAEALADKGFVVDFDLSEHDQGVTAGISAEDQWWLQLQAMIARADVIVFCVSPDSARSPICDEELVYARSLNKRVIPINHRPIDFAKASPKLAALNVKISISGKLDQGFEAGVAQLCEALDRDVAWLREHTRLQVEALSWIDAGRVDDKLLQRVEIDAAEQWAARRLPTAPAISDTMQEFFSASRAAQTARNERERATLARQRRLQRYVGVLLSVALFITLAGGWYVLERQRSVSRAQSLMLTRAAQTQIERGDLPSALRLALLAARDSFFTPAAPEAAPMLATAADMTSLVAAFYGHQGPVKGAALSSDGRKVWTWGDDGTVRTWDTATGRAASKPIQIGTEVVSIALSPRADRIAVVTADNSVTLWTLASGNKTTLSPGVKVGDARLATSVAFTEGGDYVATTLHSQQSFERGDLVRLFDTQTGAALGAEVWLDGDARFGSATHAYFVAEASEAIGIWDVGQERPSLADARSSALIDLGMPVGDWAACGGGAGAVVAVAHGGRLDFYRVETPGRPRHIATSEGGPSQAIMSWSVDCTTLFLAGRGREFMADLSDLPAIDAAALPLTECVPPCRQATPASVPVGLKPDAIHGPNAGFSAVADKGLFLTWGNDGIAALWRVAPDSSLEPSRLPMGERAEVSSDGTRLLVRSPERATLRAAATGNVLATFAGPVAFPGGRGAFSIDGKMFAIKANGAVEIRRSDSGALVRKVEPGERPLQWAQFSPGNRAALLFEGDERTLRIFAVNLKDGSRTKPLGVGFANRFGLGIDGRHAFLMRGMRPVYDYETGNVQFASADLNASTAAWMLTREAYAENFLMGAEKPEVLLWGRDPQAEIWRLDAPADQKPVEIRHTDWITAATYSQGGDEVLVGGRDGGVTLWRRVGKGFSKKVLDGRIQGVAFGGPPKRLAAFAWDGDTIVTIDLDTAAIHGRSMAQDGVRKVSVSADGARLLAVGGGKARLWDLATGTAIGAAFDAPQAVFAPEGTVVVAGARAGSLHGWQQPGRSNLDYISSACSGKLVSGNGEERRVSRRDIDSAPLLTDRADENVCSWTPGWSDAIAQALLGWAFD